MADPTLSAIAALKSGGSLDGIGNESAGSDQSSESTPAGQEGTEGTDETPSQEFDVDSILGAEKKDEESDTDAEETPAAASEQGAVEVVEIDGKKYKVDFSDKEQVRKYVRMAARMSKFQSERDQTKAQLSTIEPEYKELKGLMDQMQQHKDSPEALVKIFSGGKLDLDTIVRQRLERERLMAEATPEERAQMELKEQLAESRRQHDDLKRSVETQLKSATEQKRAAEKQSLQAQLTPVFHELSFDGKLGNPKAEAIMNGALWREALGRLQQYPENHQFSQAEVRKEFKAVRAELDSVAKSQAAKETKKVSTERKVKAKESAQLTATRGSEHSSLEQEVASKIKNGDLKGILQNPGKYFSVFNKR